MIQIELKCLNDECDYKRTLVAFLTIPFDPTKGATYAEVMATAPLLIKVQNAEGILDLTKEEHGVLVSRLQNGRYKSITADTYTMLTDIVGADTKDIIDV